MDKTILTAFKEIALFIGNKLDGFFSGTDRRLEQIKDAVVTQTTDIARIFPSEKDITTLSEAAKELAISTASMKGTNMDKFVQSLNKIAESIGENNAFFVKNQREITTLFSSIQNTIKEINTKSTKEDFRSVIGALSNIESVVNKASQKNNIDLSPLINEIKKITIVFNNVSSHSNKMNEEGFSSMIASINNLNNTIKTLKLQVPNIFKLDDMQLRQLSQSKGGFGAVAGGMSGPTTNGVVYDGRKVVSVTNTAVRLSDDQLCEEVFITALSTNTEVIVIGGPSVVFTEATRTGRAMNPGDSIVLKIHNLKNVWLNGTASDGVSFTYTA